MCATFSGCFSEMEVNRNSPLSVLVQIGLVSIPGYLQRHLQKWTTFTKSVQWHLMVCHTEFRAKALGTWDQKPRSILWDWQSNMKNTRGFDKLYKNSRIPEITILQHGCPLCKSSCIISTGINNKLKLTPVLQACEKTIPDCTWLNCFPSAMTHFFSTRKALDCSSG